MEGNGPIAGDPVYPGVILASLNAVALDTIAATLMGFDINKIKLINNSLKEVNPPNPLYVGTLDDIQAIVGKELLSLSEFQKKYNLKLETHRGWKDILN